MSCVKHFFNVIIGIPLVLLMFACPILEILKLDIFGKIDDENIFLKSKILEYFYLGISFAIPSKLIITGIGHHLKDLAKKLCEELFWVTFYWIIIAITYTLYTSNELGEIPFTCPPDYDYPSSDIKKACQIRSTNIICMWLFVVFAILWEFLEFVGVVTKVKDLEEATFERNHENNNSESQPLLR
ncbi:286_t:CDS:2 [Diversispora eburnea]|uniref:286_t:CDS:1 n=1 Tax=Diversispora eburnea TaxID=1213867 RepID=A0A9N8VP89_9GLOM|nr:286_t:CDS:2 [Diversispora eburnea]